LSLEDKEEEAEKSVGRCKKRRQQSTFFSEAISVENQV